MEKEFVEIVDRDGNSTGKIVEKEVAHDLELLHKEVRLFILNTNKEILLQKRSANKRFNPNKWGLCSGHVKAHEDNLTAVIRELKEELGIEASKTEITYLCSILEERESVRIIYCYYIFLDKGIKDFIIQEEELSEVKWFLFNDYKQLVENDDKSVTLINSIDNKKTLEMLEKILDSK